LILLPQGYEPCATSDELRGVVVAVCGYSVADSVNPRM